MGRFGKVVKAEWNHRFGGREPPPASRGATTVEPLMNAPSSSARSPSNELRAASPARRPAVGDVNGALRVLELHGTPTLEEVRARYRELARRYHPKSGSANPDEAHAARVVLDALTDALELLEEQLLPLPR